MSSVSSHSCHRFRHLFHEMRIQFSLAVCSLLFLKQSKRDTQSSDTAYHRSGSTLQSPMAVHQTFQRRRTGNIQHEQNQSRERLGRAVGPVLLSTPNPAECLSWGTPPTDRLSRSIGQRLLASRWGRVGIEVPARTSPVQWGWSVGGVSVCVPVCV